MGILDDVLDYSKIEAGHMHFERICFNLHDTLQRVADLFRARVEQKLIGFYFEMSPRTPRHVMGDPLRLSQVLNNLVSNAIKFTDTGQVRVMVDVANDPGSEGMLHLSVTDTGVGIEPDACASLFAPFVQGDDSVTRRFGGTGLGLAICKRLVEMMGGSIGVVSVPGCGSEFWFTARLDAAQPVELEGEALARPPAVEPMHDRAGALVRLAEPLRGLHLLLAEDNPLNQIVATEFLQRAGLVVTVVDDGASAVHAMQMAAPGQYAAILMDLHMPILDGFEATRRIRALPHAAAVPIIGMTAAVLAEDRERCTQAGMVDHISKPVIPEHMIKVLLKWVGSGLVEPPSLAISPPPVPPPVPPADARAHPLDLNLAPVRQRLLGREDLLHKLLDAFVNCEATTGQVMEGMLARGEIQEARRKAHDLRGVAATLGADGITEAVGALEDALRLGQNPAAALALLQSRLQSGLEAIRDYQANRSAQGPA
jgi:two-component system sensor histidine kinase/response regulator